MLWALSISSIDEVFIDVSSYLSFYNKSAYQLAQMLLLELRKRFKIPAVCGIGYNMLLAKYALDIEAKSDDELAIKDGINKDDLILIPDNSKKPLSEKMRIH